MEDWDKRIEIENRYCPICGNFVKAGSSFHRCKKKDLKKINDQKEEKENIDIERSYDEKLKEFGEFYDHETYYDKENE